jgi:hypothetical protein
LEIERSLAGSQRSRKRLVIAARGLQSMGLNPIPLQRITEVAKRPFLHKGELKTAETGFFHRASTEKDIQEWIRRSRHSNLNGSGWLWENLAVVTGSTSGLFSVDVDDESAWPYLEMLGVDEETETWKWTTGRGVQMAFSIPEGVKVPNFHGNDKLLPDVPFDIKGECGYAALPPSVHHTGREYEYVEGHAPRECSLAEAPECLILAIRHSKEDLKPLSREELEALPLTIRELLEKRGRSQRDPATISPGTPASTELMISEDLKTQRDRVKRLYSKHDLPTHPICKGGRKTTLLSHFRTIARNEDMSEEELKGYLDITNSTLLYDEQGGELEGLEKSERQEILATVIKDLPDKASPEVQAHLTRLQNHVAGLQHRLKRPRDTDAKVILGLIQHGRKYGNIEDHYIRIPISKPILKATSRIKNDKTLDRSLKRMKARGGINSYRPSLRGTNVYLLDFMILSSPTFWMGEDPRENGENSVSKEYTGDEAIHPKGGISDGTYNYNHSINIHPKGGISDNMYNYNYSINIDNNKNQKSITHTPFGVTDIESNLDAQAPSSPGAATYDYASWVTQDSEMEEIVAAVTRTTHHGGIGGASIRQLKAFLKLGGIERDSVHTKVLAKELGVAWGSIYPTLNKLKDSGIVEMVLLPGQYRLSQDFLDNLFDFRVDKGEFHKDEEIREGIEEDRKVARYETELYVALREGGNVEDAEVPVGVPHKKIVKAQAKAMASLERPRRKLEEMASTYNKDSRVDEFMMWLASNRLQYGQRGYSG